MKAHTECVEGDITTAQSAYPEDAPLAMKRHANHMKRNRDNWKARALAAESALDAMRPSLPTPAMYDTLMDAALVLASVLVNLDICPQRLRACAFACGDDDTSVCARRVVDAEIERVER